MSNPIRIVYFASLAQSLGVREEQYPASAPLTLTQLRAELIARDGPWQALAASHIKAAVNHTLAGGETQLNPGDEVAFFPPVTGG